MGPAADPAIPSLIQATRSGVWQEHSDAMLALRLINRRPDLVVPGIAWAVTNEFSVALSAIIALKQLGTNASAAVPALRWAVTHPSEDHYVSIHAANALSTIAPDSTADVTVPAFVNTLKGRRACPEFALEGLQRLGPRAKSAVPVLLWMINEKRDEDGQAAKALQAVDPIAAADAGLK
jgi:hypothetical protein